MNEDQIKAHFGAMLDDAFAKGEAVYKPLFEERLAAADRYMAELAAYELVLRVLADNTQASGIRSALAVLDITLENTPVTLPDTQRDAFQAQVDILRSALLQRLGEPGQRS